MKTPRLSLVTLLFLAVAAVSIGTACSNDHHECACEEGRHVRVRAPFTRVDVFVPDDDAEDTEVRVDVDDD